MKTRTKEHELTRKQRESSSKERSADGVGSQTRRGMEEVAASRKVVESAVATVFERDDREQEDPHVDELFGDEEVDPSQR